MVLQAFKDLPLQILVDSHLETLVILGTPDLEQEQIHQQQQRVDSDLVTIIRHQQVVLALVLEMEHQLGALGLLREEQLVLVQIIRPQQVALILVQEMEHQLGVLGLIREQQLVLVQIIRHPLEALILVQEVEHQQEVLDLVQERLLVSV